MKARTNHNRYSRIDRTRDYVALFLVGLVGWTCDQLYRARFGTVPSSRVGRTALPNL
jgi:hypothetical protein